MSSPNLGLSDVIAFLERGDLTSSSIASGILRLPFDIKPDQFLEFARTDVGENTQRSRVNALSNVKRAIDCRFDAMLFAFGLYSISKREDWNFPKKAKVLVEAGVVAPRILTRINKERNKLEHEFKVPSRREVEDSLDVAHLFLSATEILVARKAEEIQLEAGEMKPKRRFQGIDLNEGVFDIELIRDPRPPQVSSTIRVDVTDQSNYLKILGYWVRVIRQKF